MKLNTGQYQGWRRRSAPRRRGFTLIEILTVMIIIAALAAILIPVAGGARKTALKRRVMLELNSIKVAVMQFHSDHGFMPWGDPNDANAPRVGVDVWTKNDAEQQNVMRWLTGENKLNKAYLQIPEKSRRGNPPRFVDPWGQNYRIGMDRDLDNVMLPNDPDGLFGGPDFVKEKVLVYSVGDPDEKKPFKTW